MRLANYKLLERFEDGRVHLYDLSQDVGERNDLAQQMPEKVEAVAQHAARLVSPGRCKIPAGQARWSTAVAAGRMKEEGKGGEREGN